MAEALGEAVTAPRHTCPGCGRDVAQQGGVYSTPYTRYAYLRAHISSPGVPCPTGTVVLARTLLREKAPTPRL